MRHTGFMLDRLRAWLRRDGQDDAELLHRRLKQLQEELREVEWRQQQLQQEMGGGVKPEDVAIEEKVDVARLSEELEQLRHDGAQTASVEEQLAGIRKKVVAQDEEVAEAATRIESRTHEALEALRTELRETFRRELMGLMTVFTYEMDALEAREQWGRDDLEDSIEVLRETVREKLADTEDIASADDVAAVRGRVEELRTNLEDMVAADAMEELEGLVDALQDRMAAVEDDKADVETMQEAIEEVSDDVGDVQDDIIAIGTRLRDRLTELSEEAASKDAVEEVEEEMGVLSESIDGARQRITAIRDRFEQQLENLAEGKADRARVDAVFDEVRSDIAGMEETLADVGERVERLTEQKADRSELEDEVGTVADSLRTLQDRVDSMQNTLEHRVEMLAEEKADREQVTEQLDTLAEGVRNVRERLQESQDTLTSRLDELEDVAARAESVNDIHRHINALDDETEARQTAVREALKEIHMELDDLRDQHLTQADIDELQHRVQTIRERQERTIDPQEVVSRDEFTKLRSTVEDLMDLVMRALNRGER